MREYDKPEGVFGKGEASGKIPPTHFDLENARVGQRSL